MGFIAPIISFFSTGFGAALGRAALGVAFSVASSSIARRRAEKRSRAAAAERAKELAKLRARLNAAQLDAPESIGGPRPTRTENVKSPTQVHELAFGTVKKGGFLAYINGTGSNNAYLHLIVVFAAHQVQKYHSLWLNNEELNVAPGNVVFGKYANYVVPRTATGSNDQAADSFIVSENANWTTDHRLRGRAYGYVRLQDNLNLFPQFVPTLLATFDGENRIYDPRTETTGFSRNPALQAAYILETYLLVARSRIMNVSDAADICDEWVATKKGDTFTADAVTDEITLSETLLSTLEEGTPVYLLTTDTLPDPLAIETLYRVIEVDGADMKLSSNAAAFTAKTGTFTASSANIAITAHGFAVGDRVEFSTDGDEPTAAVSTFTPNGELEQGIYFVETVVDVDTITIAPYADGPAVTVTGVGTGTHSFLALDRWTGSALDLTDTGTGTHTIRVAERRYQSDGFMSLVGDPGRLLEPIVTAMAGEIIDNGGDYYILPGSYVAPVVTISDDDIVSGIKLQTASSSKTRANSIKGTFVAEDQYELTTDFPAIKDATMIAEDDGVENYMEADLEFIRSVSQAQRVASILLQDQRLDRNLSLDVNLLVGLDVQPGDRVTVNSDVLGVDVNGIYRVDEHREIWEVGGSPKSYVRLELKEDASGTYDWDAETDEQLLADAARTNIPGSNDTVPINAAVAGTFHGTAEDTREVVTADFNWTDPVSEIDSIEIETTIAYEYREEGSSDSWVVGVFTQTDTGISTGVGTFEQDIVDVDNLVTPFHYEFQNHEIVLARIRAKISTNEWGDWVVVG